MFIQTEITPNPNTLKFVPGRKLLEKGTLEFKSYKDAENFGLAKELFQEGYVTNVFIGHDFLSITKSDEFDWESIKPNVLSIITDYLIKHKTIDFTKTKTEATKVEEQIKYSEKEKEIVDQIEELLDQRIKPAVAQDGGDINFVKYDSGVVFLEMRGACSGCPSSVLTLKSGIENMLKYYIPEIVSVEAING